jgi:hypothetical protein
MIDLSVNNGGFFLHIPTCYTEKHAPKTKSFFITHANNNEAYNIINEHKLLNPMSNKEIQLYTIKVFDGCRFIGDFMQCRADNLQQLDSLIQHEYITMLLRVSNYIRFSQFKYMDMLSAFNTMVEKSITHFYCKTYPKKHEDSHSLRHHRFVRR